MKKEELIRNLKYTIKKHENDRVDTFDTNISAMCRDMLEYIEQEPATDILNKIREEIETEKIGYPPSADYYKAIMKTLYIIDKYRKEG